MNYRTLEKYTSTLRMNRFLTATGSESGAINLHRTNLQVSQAFYPVLNCIFVSS